MSVALRESSLPLPLLRRGKVREVYEAGEGLILLVASGTAQGRLFVELTLHSPLQALSTALFALLVLAAFREWFAIRLDT